MTTTRPDIARVAPSSGDLHAAHVEALKQLFPEVVTEGRIHVEKLCVLLGGATDTRPERYSFTWAGKRDAIRLSQVPSYATLVPAPEESVNFDTTRNIFIEADNLEALKLLHRAYFGRVKMIYIDPPYNTGNDFVYPDDYADPLATYLDITGQRDAAGNLLTANPETSGRYHSAWLSMMYPRLVLARSFLREDGVIFVSIDDHEVHNLRLLMNEIFGEENFVATFVWKRRASSALADKLVSVDHEYVIAYQRGGFGGFLGKPKDYSSYRNPDSDPNGPWTLGDLTVGMTKEQRPNQYYDLVDPKTGRKFSANPNRVWAYIPETMAEEIQAGRILFPDSETKRPMVKRYKANLKSEVNPISTWIKSLTDTSDRSDVIMLETGLNAEGTRAVQGLFGNTIFNYSKPVSLILSLLNHLTSGEDIILDFFAGSGTTAQAIMELNRQDGGNRRFILVQLPEPTGNPQYPTIADIGKARLRRAAATLRRDEENRLPLSTRDTPEDLGFRVFKLAPSHLRQWQPPEDRDDPNAYLRQMALTAAQPGGTRDTCDTLNVIWEAAIREGYSLTARIERVPTVTAPTVYRVTDDDKDQSFTICLDDQIALDTLRPLALTRDDLFICRDSALDDATAANLALQCRLKVL